MPTDADLFTTVKNVSGVSRSFGFLGRRGKTLANGATFTTYAGLDRHIGLNARKAKGLSNALINGYLEIMSTPKPIVADTAPTAQIANPTVAATVAPTGGGASGGLLAAGTYQVDYTWYNVWGETTTGTSRSATFTVGATNIPRVTYAAIPSGATGVRVFLTNLNTPAGVSKYYNKATTGTTLDLTVNQWNVNTQTYAATTVVAPTVNTTIGPSGFAITVANGTLGAVDPSWGRVL